MKYFVLFIYTVSHANGIATTSQQFEFDTRENAELAVAQLVDVRGGYVVRLYA